MRFACQSCGKAYNLPEEKIADKSNVKLKCRVCGAIVEVKKQGEVVASILGEGDNKRARVSEAPAPLTSMMPDDSDDATHAIAVSDQILSDVGSSEDAASALMGHVKSALGQRGLAPLPPPPATGFGSPLPLTGLGSPPPATGFGSPVPGAGFGSPLPATGFGSPPATGFGSPPATGFGSPPSTSGFGSPPPPGFGVSAPAGFAPT
ncbi:MAG TPA: zinc-ribbon domain-containing protein, partial [Polyangiaceae bacterium]|nr:zinc-ribbon domain-containing protein [Polyangiaceae bacterium]